MRIPLTSEWDERRRSALGAGRKLGKASWDTVCGRGPVRRWRRLLTVLPVKLQRVRPVYLVAVALVLGAMAYGSLRLSSAKTCAAHLFVCGAAGGFDGIVLAAILGLVGFVLLSWKVRLDYVRRARTRLGDLFPPGLRLVPLSDEVPSVAQIMDTIVPPLAGRNRLHTVLIRASSLWWPVEGEDAPPQLVVGQAGEGKTTLLAHLAEHLARRRYVPVPVFLHGEEEFDSFLDLARQAFGKTVDEQLAGRDEGDRIWRWICRSGRLVILVDDLQRVPASMHDRLYQAFLEAELRDYALVVTSRRDHRSLEQWRVPLSLLGEDKAYCKVRAYAAAHHRRRGTTVDWGADLASSVPAVIRAGELHRSRYYVSVLSRLVAHGAFDSGYGFEGRTVLEVRRWLFYRYVEAFRYGMLADREDEAADRHEREAALANIEKASYQALKRGADALVHGSRAGFDSAVQAGLLRRLDSDAAQVEHALLQSYLAARALESGLSWRELARNDRSTPEARDALLFYAGVASHAAAGDIVGVLARAPSCDDERIGTAITAADVAIAAGVGGQDEALANALDDAWQLAGALDRRALVERLARLASPHAIAVLWDNCDDPSYQVSWAAGCALAGEPAPAQQTRSERAQGAVEILAEDIEAVIVNGERFRTELELKAGTASAETVPNGRSEAAKVDDWHPRVRPLKRLGWILPVLAVGADNSDLFDSVDRVLRVFGLAAGESGDGLTVQRGPESSIAQGFKAAARLAAWELQEPPNAAVTRKLFEHLQTLHNSALFWYSRLVLLHGLTDLVIAAARGKLPADALGDQVDQARKTIAAQARGKRRAETVYAEQDPYRPDDHEHAFVVETAILCEQALSAALLAGGRSEEDAYAARNTFIWDDEGVAVSGLVGSLAPEALRLLGDVAVVLNLNEKGAGEKPDRAEEDKDFALREQFGRTNDLPVCLSARRGRRRITMSQCAHSCPFERCPYPDTAHRAHREISKLFCRQVREKVEEARLEAPRWQPRSGSAYSRFWLQMERKAKYGG
jgi:hypothetical protein